MSDLLLELFSEEIPSGMQAPARKVLRDVLSAALSPEDNGASLQEKITTYSTPRRVVIEIRDLPEKFADVSTEKRGPRIGAPEKAITGFAKSVGLAVEELEQRGEYYFAVQHTQGRPTKDALKDAIETMLANFHWKKSMRWGDGAIRWVRPLHNILCLFDGEIIPVKFGHLTANNQTYGHRFLSPDAVEVDSIEAYHAALKDKYVMLSQEKRKEIISTQAEAITKAKGLQVENNPALLDEVVGLVEYPQVLLGEFDTAFLKLPHEVIRSEMNHHQKYFGCYDAKGNIAPHFIVVSNMKAEDGGAAIVAGNERVLKARLKDAEFFWNEDQKKGLEASMPKLEKMLFHNKIGSMAQKVERIERIASQILPLLYPDATEVQAAQVLTAAQLCKADLVTEMVGEFPDLQGVMGCYYAGAKYGVDVAEAIRDHYLPRGASDTVPTAPISVVIALADRLDTLTGMFVIGEKPTGSKDPFGLRRAALGIIRIILENDLRVKLNDLLDIANPSTTAELLEFFEERLKVLLKDQGIRYDVVAASISKKDFNVLIIKKRAEALQKFLKENDSLVAGYKRAWSILETESIDLFQQSPIADLFKTEEEGLLYSEVNKVASKLQDLLKKENFQDAMNLLSALKTPIDNFFENVVVNCADEQLKLNRKKLLRFTVWVMEHLANFDKIEK